MIKDARFDGEVYSPLNKPAKSEANKPANKLRGLFADNWNREVYSQVPIA